MINWDDIGYLIGLALQAAVKVGFLCLCAWVACAPHLM